MTNTTIELSEEAFTALFPLRTNNLNPHASWQYGGGGCLFETSGDEFAFVGQQDPRTVWTLTDDDDGSQCLLSGFHIVNRIGFLVSTVAVPNSVEIHVRIPQQPDAALDEVERLLQSHRMIAEVWTVENVRDMRPDLTDEQAWHVLQECDRHRPRSGTWDTILAMANQLYEPKPDRVAMFSRVIEDYTDYDPATNLIDLLADAMHWSRAEGVSFEQSLTTATTHFSDETNS